MFSCNTKSNEPQIYNITVEESELYEVYNIEESSKAGFTIFFDVRSTSVFYKVGTIYINDQEVIYNPNIFGYSFVMPSEDVVISVDMILIENYDDNDDHLSWGSSVNGKIFSLTDEEISSGSIFMQDLALNFDGITSGNLITSIDYKIESLNQEVIPNDSLTFSPIKASTSNAIIGGKIVVDLTKVKVGKTLIYIKLDPNNASLGSLIRKFEVVEPVEPIYESMTVNFTFKNNTNYDDEGIFFNITDTLTNEINSFFINELIDNKMEFEYFVNHTYRVSCAYQTYNENYDRYEQVSLKLNKWVGTNINDAVNSLEEINNNLYLLTLSTPGIQVDFIIYK